MSKSITVHTTQMSNENIKASEEVITSGISFLRSIIDCYGNDHGVEMWNQITAVLDPSVKGKILFALLNNQYPVKQIKMRQMPGLNHPRIEGIKTIRTLSKLGLKEAKDLSDELLMGKVVPLTLVDYNRSEAIGLLRAVHIDVL